MKLKEFLKKWCEPDESALPQFYKDLENLDIQEEIILEREWECQKHKSDLPCDECQRESEQEYNEGLAEHEESEKAKQEMEENLEYEREQEFLNQGDENV